MNIGTWLAAQNIQLSDKQLDLALKILLDDLSKNEHFSRCEVQETIALFPLFLRITALLPDYAKMVKQLNL